MIVQIFLLTFIFAILFLGSFHVGTYSVRVFCTVLMMATFFLYHPKHTDTYRLKLKPLYIYASFLIVALIAKLISEGISGYDESSPFLTKILSNFLVCFVTYIAISRYVKTEESLGTVLLMLVLICAFNDYVTYLQYNGNAIGIVIGNWFSTSESEFMTFISDNIKRVQEIRSAIPGICGHGVANGYMTSVLGILSLYYLVGKGKKYWVAGIILFALALIGSFCCQERSGLGLLVLFSLFSIYKFNSKFIKIVAPVVLILLGVYYYEAIEKILTSSDMGRFDDMSQFDDRSQLVSNALQFIRDNLLWGGDVLYEHKFGLTPHNFFLHAFVYSGVFGAAVIIYLFFYIIKDACVCIFTSKEGNFAYFFACATIIFLIDSVFHSSSLVTGDALLWVMYACMLKGIQLKEAKTV